MIANISRKIKQAFIAPKAERGLTMLEIAVTSVLVAVLMGVSYSKMSMGIPKANGFAAAVAQGALEKAFSQVSNTLDKQTVDFTNGDLNAVLDMVSGSSSSNLVLSVTNPDTKEITVTVGGRNIAKMNLLSNGGVNATNINSEAVANSFTLAGPANLQRIVEVGPSQPPKPKCTGGFGKYKVSCLAAADWDLPISKLGDRFATVDAAAFSNTAAAL
ncbi:MAG: hypothetical protein K2X01_00785 [Cyanobacteria bacterium]|nr:hypothetical protein [Cyanobacteriota bacterium]